MDHLTSILIDDTVNLIDIVDSISPLLNIKFNHDNQPNGVVFNSVIGNERIYIYGDHDLEDDCGIKFSEYEYVISVESIKKYGDEAKITKIRQGLCYKIASLLRKKYHCNLLVIEDLQIILKSNETIIKT